MGDVLKLGGDRAPLPPDQSSDAATTLRALADLIEAGQEYGPLEKWVLVFQTASKNDPTMTCTTSRDSGVTLAEFCYLLESSKMDMLLAARGGA